MQWYRRPLLQVSRLGCNSIGLPFLCQGLCVSFSIRTHCTAGVWDVFSPSEAVDLVMYMTEEGSNAAVAAEQLCHEAVERSIDSEDGEADNTSAAVFIFKRGH